MKVSALFAVPPFSNRIKMSEIVRDPRCREVW